MKSKTVKLIFTALAFCLLISILAMGAFASGDDTTTEVPDISDGGTVPPTPATVHVTASITGHANVDSVSVTINNQPYTSYTLVNGSFTVDVTEGSNVSITVTPEEGYKVTCSSSGWSFSNNTATATVTADTSVSFTVTAKEKHTITTTVTNGSGVTGNVASISTNPSGEAYEGQTVYVTVWLDGGYNASVSTSESGTPLTPTDDSTSTLKRYTFTMPDGDVTVNATITKAIYEVTITQPAHGKIEYYTYGEELDELSYGDQISLRVIADDGYYLKALKLNGEAVNVSNGTYSFTVTDNVIVTAELTDELTVTTTVNNYWYGSASAYKSYWEDEDYEPGDRIYIECEPEDGYNVKDVTVTDTVTGYTLSVSQSSSDKNIYYFTMPEHPVSVYVEFQEGYAIKVADTKYGKVKVSAENADEDDVITITTEPDKGYAVSKISIKTDGGETVTYRTSIATKNSYYFYMPDDNVTITVTFGVAHKDMPFTDVHSYSWFYDAVQFVYDNDIMNGVSDTSFNPDGTVTRGMIVTMLWRMAGEPYSFGGGFSDVPAGHYCYSAAAWASRNGIVNGMTSTTFEPDSNITREQLVTILYRYAQYLGYSTTGSSLYGFTDASSVSSYATNAMSWAVKYGIISGVTTTTLVPAGTATRAQAAQMFMSFYDFLD